MSLQDRIRAVLDAEARLPVPAAGLADDDDLYRHGLTSHGSVRLMLALEDAFDIEFPDSMLSKQTFQSISSIEGALRGLGASDAAAPS